MKLHFMGSVLAFILLAGCGSDGHKGTNIVFGAVIDQTGNNSELSWLQAVQLAVSQANDALADSPLNIQFTLNAQNSENDVAAGPASRAILRIQDVVEAGAKASVIDTTQIAEEANKPQYGFGIPLQCGSCTGGSFLSATASVPSDPALQASRQNADRWMSRTIMTTSPEAQVVAQMMKGDVNGGDRNGDGKLKVCAYGSNETFGSATVAAVVAQVKARFLPTGIEMHFEQRLHDNLPDPRDIDFQADIDRMSNDINEDEGGIQDGYCDYITIATFGRNDVQFTSDFKNEGNPHDIKVIHFQTFRFSSNLLALGELAEGEIGVSHVVLDGPAGDQFATDFHAKFGLRPVYRDSIYYDNAATLLLANIMAVHQAGSASGATGQMVRDNVPCTSVNAARNITDRPLVQCPAGNAVNVQPGVQGFKDAVAAIIAGSPIEYTGASGPVDYDSEGNVKNKVASFTVQDGEYTDTAAFDCVTSSACLCTSDSGCPNLQ